MEFVSAFSMKQMSLRMPVVLITGCNTGLGLALSEALYRRKDFHTIATARGKSYETLKNRFQEKPHFWVRHLDILDDTEISFLVDELNRKCHGVDVLINNAGVCYRSVIEHMDETSELKQLKTNYLGPMSLIRAILPTMREKSSGHIINVSSVSGMMAMPTMGSYSASKHALEGATEALWYEMKPFGIKISLVQPGFIHSNSFQKVYLSKKAEISSALEGPYSDYYSYISPFIKRLMLLSRATPTTIAEKIIGLIGEKRPPLWVPVTFDAWVFGMLRKILPRRFFHRLMFLLLPGSRAWGQHSQWSRKTILHPAQRKMLNS